MKTAVTILAVALVAGVTAHSSAKPSPTKQLPDQASDRAHERSRLAMIPPPPLIPPPPPLIPPPPLLPPPVLALFTATQSSGSAAAAAAVDSATTTIRVAKAAIANATTVWTITINATRTHLSTTALPPRGRSGDLELNRLRFNDRFGRRIGDGTLLCRWVAVTRRLCWGEVRLPRGKLVVLGSSQTRALGELAVIGGTGVYVFKQGILTFRLISELKYAIKVLLA